MIDLTPLEVRQKKDDFRRGFRGYDVQLVDDFLDLVADRMEDLVKDNMSLHDRVHLLESEMAAYRDKEQAMADALMTAQRLRDDARVHAEKEAELLLKEARLAAESARADVAKQLVWEEETLRQVRARRAQLIQSFRRLLERELGELTVIEETLGLESGDAPGAEANAAEAAEARTSERTSAGTSAPAPEARAEGEDAAGTGEEDPDEQRDWLSSLVEEE